MGRIVEPRNKIYAALGHIANKFHYAPITEGPNGKLIHKNLVLMTLTYLLDKNHLLIGEPGWGKTTSAKIVAARLSGVPYDLFDALEIRGNPQKYEEKIVGRPHYGKIAQGEEDVVWQGTFGLPVLVVDEGNRLPYDSQDVILQGIDTGRWNYQNRSLFEGKKPTFMTINEKPGHHQNGFIRALKDRLDIVTEEGYWTSMILFDLEEAKANVEQELCRAEHTTKALDALAKSYPDFRRIVDERELEGHLTPEEKRTIQEKVMGLELDNDGMLFLQAFMAEVDYSAQYGFKRASDPISTHTHDKNYAGVSMMHSFSPRTGLAALYAKALAWFLQESPGIDHIRFVLPHLYAHKAEFTGDYRDAHGNDIRTDCEILHLAKQVVEEAYQRYTESIQPMKNFIARIQRREISAGELEEGKVHLSDGSAVSLKEDDHDHPLMKDLVSQAKAPEKAFYEEG